MSNEKIRQPANAEQLNAYIGLTADAADLIEELYSWIDDHGEVAPDDVTDIHVMRMASVVENLKRVRYIAGISARY